ncbi:BCCT family transporter [Halobacillus salinarum]|uniref:BCCT family transporter n=1 Tax=Halobacillus salinarum TaxID=2932257 RepID=A0ABY4EK80_9BACI|nr:BCCT family transporter [Halobacillus salinarum]UOQ44268.1 BCCT family transporter [Halobacillus salinarum]
MPKLRHAVFWPPFLLLIGAAVLSLFKKDVFVQVTTSANNWVINEMGWLFSVGGLLMVAGCVLAYFSPLGDVKIGGKDAKPTLGMMSWFAIALTTTIATLTFWSLVEPVYHLSQPPASLGIEPHTPEAAMFALSTMYLHWTITPYAIYTVPTIVFAFSYYNMKNPYSLSSPLVPLLGKRVMSGKVGSLVDGISLYTLATGMAASMGTSILNLSGGINYVSGIKSTPVLWAIVAGVVMFTFVISSSTGLMKGIRYLSNINMRAFVLITIFVFIVGPTSFMLNAGTEAFGNFLSNFFEKSLFTGELSKDSWPGSWTTFYWASWFAWAMIISLFLGRIAYGYKVKTVILVNFVFPAIFGAVWISVFGGTAVFMDLNGGGLTELLTSSGPETVLYGVFAALPWSKLIIPFFIFIVFVTFVTACDSNNAAMSGISSHGISPENPEPSTLIKVVWGVTVSIISWTMISFANIDGVKMLNNLGGVPALLLELIVFGSLMKIAKNPWAYDKTNSYRENNNFIAEVSGKEQTKEYKDASI